ncbi:sugar phosphate isomerase/epimerase family protein [Cohnella sp. GCM10027633]|uniref:sugar phosphate isomerase/epimerase family protein n=1 Tax=unclassified Cohnella TaxID=2636738 RepID=UPI003636A92F
MKLGVSSYSLAPYLREGKMTIYEAIRWVADNGGEHIEIVPSSFDFDPERMPERIREAADEAGIAISNYAIGANFLCDSEEDLDREIRRVMDHVDIARRLGVKRMRHDVGRREKPYIANLVTDIPVFARACREIADYASAFGIVTSLENHGYYLQGTDRVQWLIHEVGRENFRLTLDVGNYLCADENPVMALNDNLRLASIVHLKDFYVRPPSRYPGEGWFASSGGSWLRGAIVGHGDIDMQEVIRQLIASGYDGFVTIEFEGLEDCLKATRLGLSNARRIEAEIRGGYTNGY